jgi:tRNA dimethylallyltransferase
MLRIQENPILREELSVYDMPSLIERFLKVRPQAHNRTDLDDRKRLIRAIEIAESSALRGKNEQICPEYDCLVLGIRWERSVLRRRIQERLKYRLNAGLIDEVKRLHESGVTWERLDTIGLEYRYVSKYLQGQMDILEMEKKLLTRIQQFAKRQDTWFRKMERAGIRIHWIAGNDYPALQSAVDQWLSNQ